MKNLINNHAKQPYKYTRYYFNEMKSIYNLLKILPSEVKQTSVGRGKYAKTFISNVHCGFDIETYTTESHNGYMYIWQFSINKNVIIGRSWKEFTILLDWLIECLELQDNTKKLIVWVANLSYEFQFMRKWLEVTDYFFRESRKPFKVTHKSSIEFMDCLPISGGNLDYLAKTYVNTQKCLGDLDYTIPRNSETTLTHEEMTYCDNDVLILSEWGDYYFKSYIDNNQAPITLQSTIRKEMKEGCKEWWKHKGNNPKNGHIAVMSCQPSEDLYQYLMRWCFRGGYTHGNLAYTSIKLVNKLILSFDFTSSYPACMLHGYYPSRLYKKENCTIAEYYEMIKKKCVIATIRFEGLKNKYTHSIESTSKCIELINPMIDNGRVLQADTMTVCLTELDFRTYTKFYTWESMSILNCYYSNRVKIPDYVIKPMCAAYKQKAKLKASGLNYEVPKAKVNSFYGVMVTKLNATDIKYEDNEYIEEPAQSYIDQIRNNVLLPQWGIYISSWGRFNILSLLASLSNPNDCLYIDTDSIKIKNGFKDLNIIKQYNQRIFKKNKKICEKYNLDYEIFKDIGALDYEGKMMIFKCWGAKRYMYTSIKKGKLHDVQTIAGLPKNALVKKSTNRTEMYEMFQKDMILKEINKLYSCYNDDESSEYITDTQGNTVLMKEKSNIGLAQNSFTMSVNQFWYDLFKTLQAEEKSKEKR